MLTAIKVIILVAIVLLFVYPFIFLKNKFGVLFPARRLRYEAPKTRKNFIFIFLAIAEIILLAFIFKIFDKISEIIYSIPFISSLMKSASGALSSKTHYIILAIKAILINIIAIYAFLILKGFIKKFLIDLPDRVREVGLLRAIFGKKKKSKKKKFDRFIAVKANISNQTYSEPDNIFEVDPDLAELLLDVIREFENPAR